VLCAIRLGQRNPDRDEPRVRLAQWAAELAVQDGITFAGRIADSGVRVVGDLANLYAPPSVAEDEPDGLAAAVHREIAVEALTGARVTRKLVLPTQPQRESAVPDRVNCHSNTIWYGGMGNVDGSWLWRAACRCGPDPSSCLNNDEIVTQWAPETGEFRRRPRPEMEVEVSVLRGRLSAISAAERIRVAEKKRTNSRVRYARVGDLREAGFAVVHTPGRVAGGVHCSVVFPSFDPLVEQAIPWPDKVSDEFDRCFEGEGLIKGKRS